MFTQRQAELLGKKYEEKYKQVAEIASKLTIEEASFRDTQVEDIRGFLVVLHATFMPY